jgi:hypothetical protein
MGGIVHQHRRPSPFMGAPLGPVNN